ncbi:hypothetical protein MCOR27_006021 [Pyricularia oryzae]|nr:hypothetical protein MCOR27_006021 [Pyricularia oryzae]KAI6281571.1 hypothetical protein MCOR26_003241 [Pyricularia oryzae]KAI6316985.1 hypothetical protein MCOR29_006535 [Pyricularia oryzae]KAI6334276.1 hypothetical protein MCOR28_010127 [Pyricularia oryzae]KAI6363550.1 hypothetical protein MCOR31_007800 [Pyricularia oryzae]
MLFSPVKDKQRGLLGMKPYSARGSMRSSSFPPRRPSSIIRYLGITFVIILTIYYLQGSSQRLARPKNYPPERTKPEESTYEQQGQQKNGKGGSSSSSSSSNNEHPIDKLIRDADANFRSVLSKESRTLEDAAARYRERRGRHPPPGFDQWWQLATANRAIVVEDFWDQIYTDLEPFWGLPPAQLRKEAWDFEMTINVRNKTASAQSDWFWTQIWLDMIRQIESYLPDMDIALNAMDEPRIVTPWEDIDRYVTEAKKTRKVVEPKEVIREFSSLPKPTEGPDKWSIGDKKNWETKHPYWEIARRGCPPDSPARTSPVMRNFDHEPVIVPSNAEPHMYQGFVSNYTLATSICHQPDIQGLHGIFVEPLSISTTRHLFPMFGGSKLATNNEILLPAPMYWSGGARFTADGYDSLPWGEKKNGVTWRGVATGGRTRANNWKGFQRHRFLAMNNGTAIAMAEKALPSEVDKEPTPPGEAMPVPKGLNFALPDKSYNLAAQQAGKLSQWVAEWSNMAFTDLNCQPQEPEGRCSYTGHAFELGKGLMLAEMFEYKFLPDIDGNSFSGRYLGFLKSTSLPIKSTLFREWHDSRLVAWKHFVPLDARFGDWHAIIEYFLGYTGTDKRKAAAHDAEAEKIAIAGREWAELALRSEDMLIYVLRLLLEYARLSDDRREMMGFVEDLLPKQTA